MENNAVLRRLRYILNIDDRKMAEIFSSGGREIDISKVSSILKKDDEDGYTECSDDLLTLFLDNLIVEMRGPGDPAKHPPKKEMLDNNTVLKKLRIAFNFREEDMIRVFSLGGYEISKAELSAFFRRKEHKNYKECGDQLLRKFLKGLSEGEE